VSLKKNISCILAFSTLLVFGLYTELGCASPGDHHAEFRTKYTVEEHIERITKRTEERFATQIEEGELISWKIEIVYAFYDNDPEYFLVELEYAEEIESGYEFYSSVPEYTQYITKYQHIIGYIKDDRYLMGLPHYDLFMDGRSVWALNGYEDSKKYYGDKIQAVQVDKEIMQLCDLELLQAGNVEFHNLGSNKAFEKIMVNKADYKDLMQNNFKLLPRNY